MSLASNVWIASAMISRHGWNFLQECIPKTAVQSYLIGIDLATEPYVFEKVLANLNLNARVYESEYTFHPKVYIIKKPGDKLIAFIGSSNTTSWGLEKNVEMNFQVEDQSECRKLVNWFNGLFAQGYLVTDTFLNDYKARFTKAIPRSKEIESEVEKIKSEVRKDKGQFFRQNQHTIFKKEYHYVKSSSVVDLRRSVRDSLRELHRKIYPQFAAFGMVDLHCHHASKEITSRHYFNSYSGKFINAMWLHYGKSLDQLQNYQHSEQSFINNIRIQVIMHPDTLGIWLVLGKNLGSKTDRAFFRKEMKDPSFRKTFFNAIKQLGNDYWINIAGRPSVKSFNTPDELAAITAQESFDDYFIIGCEIDSKDKRLSQAQIENTVLSEFSKLYSLYDLMRHK